MREQLIDLLTTANNESGGKLIQIDIVSYVDKILKNATIITINKNAELQGFIAYYDNDIKNKFAYLTMIAIRKENENSGYGKMLMELSIKEIKKLGFKKYRLEVYDKNMKAINLYKKYGFVEIKRNFQSLFMEKCFE
jgi:ribosomal protein S18 acetylase RimI-like enzyme